jgi:hypothetical protein
MNSRKSKPPLSTRPSNDRLAARWVREWLLVAAALLMLGGGIGWSLYHDRQELEGEERERLSRRASMIDENIRRQLFATNRALESIRRDLPLLKRQKDSTGLINDRLQALVEVMPGVRTLLVYDADATVIASNRKELIGRNFRERDYVKAALQSRNPAVLHLSAPYTTALGAFAMTAVKLIADDRGQVLGMVGVSVDPDYFKTLLHCARYAGFHHAFRRQAVCDRARASRQARGGSRATRQFLYPSPRQRAARDAADGDCLYHRR